MSLRRLPHLLPLALVVVLLNAAPALAGGTVSVNGTLLVFAGGTTEPNNVTIAQVGDVLRLDERASRMTAGAGCNASADGYRVTCAASGVERLAVTTSDFGSDVRIRANLPADLQGGRGDDVLVGGPADDTIDGGAGQDVVAGGRGSDLLRGGAGVDLVSYTDGVAANGTLLARHGGVRVAIDAPRASGAPGEGDSIERDVEQAEGSAGADRFELRDGQRTAVACGAGRDLVVADARDDEAIDCERTRVAPAPGAARIRIPTLTFPFAHHADSGHPAVSVAGLLPLSHGAVVVHVSCPVAIGLLDVDGPGCGGRVRIARGGSAIGVRRVSIRRGRTITLTLPLTGSRALARRAGGLALTVSALPDLGHVQRDVRFAVRG